MVRLAMRQPEFLFMGTAPIVGRHMDETEFVDARGRTITVRYEWGEDIEACDGKKRVGTFVVLEGEELWNGKNQPWIYHQIHVDKEYTGAGIGSKLIETAFDMYGSLQFRDADDPMNENFPTIDGMKLLYKAVRKGWVIDFGPTEDS